MLRASVIGLCVVCSALASQASAENSVKPPPPAIIADPAVREGRLANGLRYRLMPNALPAGAISLQLVIPAGSYDEQESERGAAHFIEHLTFRSSGRFPGALPDRVFAPLGVEFGRDLNAYTSLYGTVYKLDLPASAAAKLDVGLDWLRSVADGTRFEPTEIEIERGVIRAELEARNSPQFIASERTNRFFSPSLRSLNRSPGGTPDSIAGLNAATLRAFYDRWYRPETAVLVIAGDKPAEEMEALVKAAFADWRPRGPAGVRQSPQPVSVSARGLEAFAQNGPGLPTAVASCRLAPPDPVEPDEIARLRREAHSAIWAGILNKRIEKLPAQGAAKLLGGTVFVDDSNADSKKACLLALPVDEEWETALASIQAEFRRFAAQGPTELEIESAIEARRGLLRGGVNAASARTSPALASAIVQSELARSTFVTPRQALRVFDLAVEGTTVEDLKAAYRNDWRGDGPLLSATGVAAIGKAPLLAAWNRGAEAVALAAYVDGEVKAWPYDSFGRPGKIVRRETLVSPDFKRFTFANGAVLNFKQTALQDEDVEIRVAFGWGRGEIAARNFVPMLLATTLFSEGGLGKLTAEEIRQTHDPASYAFQISTLPKGFRISASPSAGELEQQLQLLAAYATDPGFRDAIDARLPTAVELMLRLVRTNPNAQAQDAMLRALFPNGIGSLPPDADMKRYRSSDFGNLLRPIVLQSPVEVTIVGDVAEADAIEAMSASFGAIPRRQRAKPPIPDDAFNTFPDNLPAMVATAHDGPADKASAVLAWPLFVATAERRKEEYALHLLARVFSDRLLNRLRKEMGKTYSPSVVTVTPDDADQGYLAASLEALPQDIDALIAATRAIATELQTGGVTEAEFEAARAPILAAARTRDSRNGYWANLLSFSSRSGGALEEDRNYEAIMTSLVAADAGRAAATWLAKEPAIARALPKAEGSR